MNKKGIRTLLIGIVFMGITVLFYSNFSLYTEYNFSSNNYSIENNYIYNISSSTTIDLYKKYFDIKNYKLKIENTSNYISNGSKTLVLAKNDRLIFEFINIVKGDIVSDGIIDYKDLTMFSEYIDNNYQLKDYELKCLDINKDNKVTREDLNLLEDSLNNGITDIVLNYQTLTLQVGEKTRLVGTTTPSYGVNTNLLWSSSNNNIISVDESGLITPHKLGIATITVQDLSGTIKKEINIAVDNTIKLSSNEGTLFTSDEELMINIISQDYKGIKCQSNNPNLSSCRIDNNILYIKSLSKGNSIITVTSPKYGNTTYNLTTYDSYLDFIPEYYCMPINKKDVINLEYIYNNLEVTNYKYINSIRFDNNQLYIQSLANSGREELIIKDNNNNTKQMIIDVYKLNIPSIGAFIKKGTERSSTIIKEQTGVLQCISPNENVAECYIKDNKLYVKGISRGEATLKITNTNTYNDKEYSCGETTFLAVITD